MSSKFRVQAQRKFAQGAFIPPHANNNNVERRSEPTDKPAPPPAVIQNMSARELLDRISFNNIHVHERELQPVVRLERLPRIPPERRRVRKTYAPDSVVSFRSIPSLYRIARKARVNRISRIPRKRGPAKKIQKKPLRKKRISRDKTRPLRFVVKRKIRCCTEDTDTEDDTPLQFLVNASKRPKAAVASTSGLNLIPRTRLKSPIKSPQTALSPQSRRKPSPSPPRRLRRSNSPAAANVTVSPGKGRQHPAKNEKGTAQPAGADYEGFYSADNIERWITASESASQFKVPYPPKEKRRASASTIRLYQNGEASGVKVPTTPATSHGAVLQDLTHTTVIIEDMASWPAANTSQNDGRSNTTDTLPVERLLTNSPLPRPPSTCPSERYVTVRDVVRASSEERRSRCRTCPHCSRADKVEKLTQVVRATTHRRGADVYEFDAERDGNDSTFKGFRSRRRNENEDAAALETDYVYLDLLPSPATQVIQIKLTHVPNQRKPMIQARLMPKDTSVSFNDFSLVDHEGLFEQLVETLDPSDNHKGKNVSNPPDKEPVAGRSRAPDRAENDNTADSNVLDEPLKNNKKKGRGRHNAPTRTRRGQSNNNKSILTLRKGRPPLAKSSKKDIKTSATPAKASPTNPLASSTPLTAAAADPQPSTSAAAPVTAPNKEKSGASIREAPVYYPTEAEFNDPVAYFEKIMPTASKFGLCKVVAPASFKPKCTVNDKIRFNVANQYIARLYTRWGPACKEMCAIKAHLASQSVPFTRAPILDSVEVDLPKLYRTVQRFGGLNTVIEKKLWGRVAEHMRFAKRPKLIKKLDEIYVRYLLPYDTLSSQEREDIRSQVYRSWHKKNEKILQRMSNPLYRQKQLLGEHGSPTSDTEEESNIACALTEAEDCIVSGIRMTLANFTKVAQAVKVQYFPDKPDPTPREVEEEYWRIVLLAAEHICVNTASIDTGEEGYGFPKSRLDPYGRHPWNPKMISQNPGNVLAMLGSVLGVTVPTLHLGMIFSTSCWHRDPHGLPWLEYMHSGPAKIWYGIPDDQSAAFRRAVERLCPTSCQNKSIWLSSDITMIPPNFLLSSDVSLTRVEQKPGEYIIVFPKAYSSSISTGYTQSESVYFATNSWLKSVDHVFHELRDSCEPTMFSLEQLLISVAGDPRAPPSLLQLVHTTLATVVDDELQNRRDLTRLGLLTTPAARPIRNKPAGAWNDECEVCRATLYLSKVTGLIERSSVCLKHALRLLTTNKTRRDAAGLSLVVYFTKDQLEEVMRRLQNGILK